LRPPINEDPQPEDPPADEDPIFQDDLIAETAVERPSSALASAKRDPITILHSATGVRTEDLSYFAAIPEQWMADVTYVEFWLDASSVNDDPAQRAIVAEAERALQAAGHTLCDTQSLSLMSRVTWRDRSQVTSTIDPGNIRANTSRSSSAHSRYDQRCDWFGHRLHRFVRRRGLARQ